MFSTVFWLIFVVYFITFIASAKCIKHTYFQNNYVATYIDISSQLVIVNYTVGLTVKNNHTDPKNSYFFISDPRWKSNISFIKASDEKGNDLHIKRSSRTELGLYEIVLHDPIFSLETVQLNIFTVISNYLQSYPKVAKQGEKHLVLFPFNLYYYSLYFTQKQVLYLYLGTNEIKNNDGRKYIVSNDRNHPTLIYGPHFSKKPMSQQKDSIHYENQSPFLLVDNLRRFVQLSHWGFIQVKDDIGITHVGPKFVGPFKRQENLPPDTRIEYFITALPEDAFDITIRDEIGLLWSFSIDDNNAGKVLVKIRPRFILYGGWKTEYQISYTLPASNYIKSSRSNFLMDIHIFDEILPHTVIKEAEINIILPEGATFQDSFSYKNLTIHDKKYCYFLDFVCREIISLKSKNLVDYSQLNIFVVYSHPWILLWFKPVLCTMFLYITFLVILIYRRWNKSTSTNLVTSRTVQTTIKPSVQPRVNKSSQVLSKIKKRSCLGKVKKRNR